MLRFNNRRFLPEEYGMSKIVKAVVNTGAFGIIKSEKSNEAKEMHYVGKIDKDISRILRIL